MTAKQALKACNRLSSEHGFIVTERQHLCRHTDGSASDNPEFSICIFYNGDMTERFASTEGFKGLIPQVKASIKQ